MIEEIKDIDMKDALISAIRSGMKDGKSFHYRNSLFKVKRKEKNNILSFQVERLH